MSVAPDPREWGGMLEKLLKATDHGADLKNLRKQLDEILDLKKQLVAATDQEDKKDPAVRKVDTSLENMDMTYDVVAVERTLATANKFLKNL